MRVLTCSPLDCGTQAAVEQENPETVSVFEIKARFPRGADLVTTITELVKKGAAVRPASAAHQGAASTSEVPVPQSHSRPLAFSLPEVDPLYVSRDGRYVDSLTSLLADGRSCVCLVGGAGLGKSNMALDIGHALWRRSLIPGGGVMVDLRLAITRSDIEGRFCAALGVDKVLLKLGGVPHLTGHSLRLPSDIPSTPIQGTNACAALMGRLADIHEAFLLVIDNAEDSLQPEALPSLLGEVRLCRNCS
jgi:hypothetical protein